MLIAAAIAGLPPGPIGKQQLRATIALEATRIRAIHESQLLDQTLSVAELRAGLEYAFTERWGIEAQVPIRLIDSDHTRFGFGDPWLTGRGEFDLAGTAATLRAGVTLPLGRVEEQGLEHQHLQLGTGTVNPVISLILAHRPWRDVEVSLQADVLLVLYASRNGYRAGNRYAAGLWIGVDLADWITISLGTDVTTERPERWDSVERTDGNLARTDLLLAAALQLRVGGLDLSVSVRVPAYVHVIVNQHQLAEVSYPGLLSLSVGKSFQL